MEIVKRLCELIPAENEQSGAVEFGASAQVDYGNSLYDYELARWKVICIQADPDIYDELRTIRRLCLNVDCLSPGGPTLDNVFSRINIDDIKILLIKNTKKIVDVLKGFSLESRKTELVCIEQSSEIKPQTDSYLSTLGFKFHERFI